MKVADLSTSSRSSETGKSECSPARNCRAFLREARTGVSWETGHHFKCGLSKILGAAEEWEYLAMSIGVCICSIYISPHSGPDPNVGGTGHMRGCDRQHSATNTRPDGHLESGFFFEFPHKAGLRSLVDLYPGSEKIVWRTEDRAHPQPQILRKAEHPQNVGGTEPIKFDCYPHQ